MAQPLFNAAGDERTGGQFWLFVALNETVVHGVDAALAAAGPTDIDGDVAAALVSNHLQMLTSALAQHWIDNNAHVSA